LIALRRYLAAMQRHTFTLRGEFVELNQLLKLVGICMSGGEGKQLVAEGGVTVDGQQELRKTCKVRSGQVVRWEDHEITVEAA
jgi:ribosome-associated protein